MNRPEFKHLVKKYITATASFEQRSAVEVILEKLQNKNQHIKAPVSQDTGERIYAQIQKKIGGKKNKNFVHYKIVATILFLLCLGGLSVHFFQQDSQITQVTQRGEKKSIVLNDGSRITLNSDSEIKYPGNFTEEREVSLNGEAFFEVARNTEKPFRITSEDVQTTVLGTSFNINTTKKGCVKVSVNTGKVKVVHRKIKEDTLILEADTQIEFAEDGRYKVTYNSSENYNAWTRNTIVLEAYSLRETAQILENWYDVEINFEEESVKEMQITGKFKNEKLVNILKSIALIKNLKIAYDTPKKINIRKNPKNLN